MLDTKVFEDTTDYLFIVTDETTENTFHYKWSKKPPEDQSPTDYLQSCKRESELLAQYELSKKIKPQEIQI